jgi:hypothetical protein
MGISSFTSDWPTLGWRHLPPATPLAGGTTWPIDVLAYQEILSAPTKSHLPEIFHLNTSKVELIVCSVKIA